MDIFHKIDAIYWRDSPLQRIVSSAMVREFCVVIKAIQQSKCHINTHTHTHTDIYIYIYINLYINTTLKALNLLHSKETCQINCINMKGTTNNSTKRKQRGNNKSTNKKNKYMDEKKQKQSNKNNNNN